MMLRFRVGSEPELNRSLEGGGSSFTLDLRPVRATCLLSGHKGGQSEDGEARRIVRDDGTACLLNRTTRL